MSERAESSGTAFWGDTDDTEALQRCRTLVNTIDDGIYQLNAEDRFVAVNDVIVERHGGDIWVGSDPGEGTTFSFTLPAGGEHSE